MNLQLRPASDCDRDFCEALSRRNMEHYRAARGIVWDPHRFQASWVELENWIIESGSEVVGLLRFADEQDALGLRDLQVVPARHRQGIGAWALREAQQLAARRGYPKLQLRVFAENPARILYERMGFDVEREEAGTVHMAFTTSVEGQRARLQPNTGST